MMLFLLASTSSRLLTRIFTQKTTLNPYAASLLLQLGTYLTGLIYGLSQMSQPLFQGLSASLLVAVVLMSCAMVLFGKVSFITQKHVDTAPFTVMRLLSVPVSIILSYMFMGDSLALPQIIGMIAIIVGVSIIATAGKSLLNNKLGRYELLCILNSIFLGFYVLYTRLIIAEASLATYLVVVVGIEVIPSALVLIGKTRLKPDQKDLKLSIGAGIATSISIITFWTAFEIVNNLAAVSNIAVFRLATIAIASYLLLNEKSHVHQKIAGTTLAIVGLIIAK
jgi:drug/metabolite transporter (DMT)-like permease